MSNSPISELEERGLEQSVT